MKTINTLRKSPLLLTAGFLLNVSAFTQAADQFVLVSSPGWTHTSQYSWTGAWGDYDNDGFIDLFVPNTTSVSGGAWTNFLYHNNRDGTFTRMLADEVGTIASDKQGAFGGYWGDVNNDGALDLIANQVYLNQGNGPFRAVNAGDLSKPSERTYYTGYWRCLADYDNDGYLDVFVPAADIASGHRTNFLFHGVGNGTFRFVTNSVVVTDRSNYANDATWGDFDNDGWPDLIVVNWSGYDFVYHNDGHGQFTRLTNSILAKYSGSHHAWADYNNDGYLDLVAGNSGGNTRLFLNQGNGQFLVATNLTADTATSPAWADYDNDGYLDLLLIQGQSASVPLRLYRNNGDGTFTRVQDAFSRTPANWMGGGWGDYDNDGFMDLFLTQTSGANKLYHNLGTTNHWIKFQLQGVVANRTAIGAKVRVKATVNGKTAWQMREVSGGNYCQNDLRPNFGLGDATKVDLVRIEWPSGNVQELTNVTPNQMLTVTEAVAITPTRPSSSLNGLATLTSGISGSYQWRFEGIDLAGETNKTLNLVGIQASQAGPYSVVVTTASQTVTNHVYFTVDSTFTKITTGPLVTDLGNSGATWGAFNAAGYPDVFVLRYKVGLSTLYHNNRDGTFSASATLPSQSAADAWVGAASADFDNDGNLDLYVARENKTGVFHFNKGDGTFTVKEFQNANPWNVAVADYDRDGLLDLYLSNDGRLFRNNGDRSFTRMSTVGAGMWGGAAWADYNDDGWPELFCGSNIGTTRFYQNDRTGRFVSVVNLITHGLAFVGAWGDYDNDGLLDLCAPMFGGTTCVYHNQGNGVFEQAAIGQTIKGNYNGACWGDYDNDGFLDLFLTKSPSPNELYRNNGDGTFTRVTTGSPVTDIPLGGGGTSYTANEVSSYWGFWFDYDNDGFLDLFVPNGNDAATAKAANFLYHNNGNSNSWLKVKLIGTASNHDGVGAKVRAQAQYAGQVRWQRRDISAGDVANGNNLYAQFGLGDATNVPALRIEWPSGNVQELTNVTLKQFLTIWEPPALSGAVLADGTCRLTITAEPERPWQIQASTDLQTWQTIKTVTNTQATFQYMDAGANATDSRFYRVVTE